MESSAQTTRGKVFVFFVKPKNGLVWPVFPLWCFPGGFRHNIGPLSSNWCFSKSEVPKHTTSVILVCCISFSKKLKKWCFVLCKPSLERWGWNYQVHANRLDFFTYIKNQFLYEPRHLRRVWDQIFRVYFVGTLFSRVLKIWNQKWITQKYTQKIWILLAETFPMVVSRNCHSPCDFFGSWFFVGLYWTSNPAVCFKLFFKIWYCLFGHFDSLFSNVHNLAMPLS